MMLHYLILPFEYVSLTPSIVNEFDDAVMDGTSASKIVNRNIYSGVLLLFTLGEV